MDLEQADVNKVCDLLLGLQLPMYVEEFRRCGVNGRKLAACESVEEIKEFGVSKNVDARLLYSEVQKWKNDGVPNSPSLVETTDNKIEEPPKNMKEPLLSRPVQNANSTVQALAKDTVKVAAITANITAQAVRTIVGGRTELDAQIANHYLDGMKYGLAGSDGSFWSNYKRYTLNNHELLSLFFADKRNPLDKKRRFLILFNKWSLSLLLAAAFLVSWSGDSFTQAFVISIVMGPYGLILNQLGACTICTKTNACVNISSTLGFMALLCFSLLSVMYVVAAALILHYNISEHQTSAFLQSFFFANIFDSLSFFYFGILNWVLVSWNGWLILPIFFQYNGRNFPPQLCPLLGIPPLSLLLGLFDLGGTTYGEDKAAFEKAYPGRICVDVEVFKDTYQPPNVV